MKYLLSLLLLLQYTISVDVDLVTFNITVLDEDNRTVTGLTTGSFRIFEDGKEQSIKIFQPEDTPATLGLVLDNSGSMMPNRAEMLTAAIAFVGASHPDDEMFIVNFNRRAWLALPGSKPFSGNALQLRAALMTTTAEGKTALYDGLDLALNHLKKGTLQRKALVLLSDGADNASTCTLNSILHLAQQSSATIFTIGMYDPDQKDRNPKVLRRLARLTGGEAYFPKKTSDLHNVWPRIAGSIRGQYTIGYLSTNPARDGAYRKVRIVAVDKKGKPLDVRARPGYFAGSTAAPGVNPDSIK